MKYRLNHQMKHSWMIVWCVLVCEIVAAYLYLANIEKLIGGF